MKLKNKKNIISVFFFVIICINASGFINTNLPPIVIINKPHENMQISSSLNISLSVVDDYGISKIVFYLNNKKIGEVVKAPYEFSFDLSAYKSGKYRLKAIAIDNSNKKGEHEINIFIKSDNYNNKKTKKFGILSVNRNGNASFSNYGIKGAFNSGFKAEKIVSGDFDGDGNLDLLGIFQEPGGLWMIKNSDKTAVKISDSTKIIDFNVGDLNRDGLDDIICTFKNGLFFRDSASQDWFYLTESVRLVYILDINRDNKQDIIAVFKNGIFVKLNGSDNWRKIGEERRVSFLGSIDFNRDGYKELGVIWSSYIYYYNYIKKRWINTNIRAKSFKTIDLNGDGFEDFIYSNSCGTYMRHPQDTDLRISHSFGSFTILNKDFIKGDNFFLYLKKEDLSDYGPGGISFEYK